MKLFWEETYLIFFICIKIYAAIIYIKNNIIIVFAIYMYTWDYIAFDYDDLFEILYTNLSHEAIVVVAKD